MGSKSRRRRVAMLDARARLAWAEAVDDLKSLSVMRKAGAYRMRRARLCASGTPPYAPDGREIPAYAGMTVMGRERRQWGART